MSDAAQPPAERPDYTVVLTSCGRFDLLFETIESLLAHLDWPPRAFVITEDSGDPAIRAALAPLAPACGFDIVLNDPQLGQMRSIDLAYGRVETPYIFHCEDDWLFFRHGFLRDSLALLAARAEVSMVGLRPRAELNPRVRDAPERRLAPEAGGVAHFDLDPALHPEYFSYSFNPGLRRTADARARMPFAPLGAEEDVSYAFKQAGFRMANLADPAVRHIGDGRHVDDPTQAAKARTMLQRLRRSARKRLKRVSRAFGR